MESHLELFFALNRAECDLENLRAAWKGTSGEEERHELRDRAGDLQAHIDDMKHRMARKTEHQHEITSV